MAFLELQLSHSRYAGEKGELHVIIYSKNMAELGPV
jgi:hypothetical protein